MYQAYMPISAVPAASKHYSSSFLCFGGSLARPHVRSQPLLANPFSLHFVPLMPVSFPSIFRNTRTYLITTGQGNHSHLDACAKPDFLALLRPSASLPGSKEPGMTESPIATFL
jgi:hypothetical protein